MTEVKWDEALEQVKNQRIACLLGVGFSAAILSKGAALRDPENAQEHDRDYTSNWLIPELISICSKDEQTRRHFPILHYLYQDAPGQADALNYLWTNKREFARIVAQYWKDFRSHVDSEKGCPPEIASFSKYLCRRGTPIDTVNSLLGAELRRMLARVYRQDDVKSLVRSAFEKKQISPLSGLAGLFERREKTTWISLNYDTTLEESLDTHDSPWRYCFDELLPSGLPTQDSQQHIVIKPHGSLNIGFRTYYPHALRTLWPPERREAVATHQLGFAYELETGNQDGPSKNLYTCNWQRIGLLKNPNADVAGIQYRPWLIGYVPDSMQREVNSPGEFADPAHDLCKANVAFAGLELENVEAVFILGYSMPPEDKWLWNRVESLRSEVKQNMKVFVASREDCEKIMARLRRIEFRSENLYKVNCGNVAN